MSTLYTQPQLLLSSYNRDRYASGPYSGFNNHLLCKKSQLTRKFLSSTEVAWISAIQSNKNLFYYVSQTDLALTNSDPCPQLEQKRQIQR